MEVLVKQKLEEDQNEKWRITLGDDRIANHDLAAYVVSIVDWGKKFARGALESSPYGSIAWAGVCLLLPVSKFSIVTSLVIALVCIVSNLTHVEYCSRSNGVWRCNPRT